MHWSLIVHFLPLVGHSGVRRSSRWTGADPGFVLASPANYLPFFPLVARQGTGTHLGGPVLRCHVCGFLDCRPVKLSGGHHARPGVLHLLPGLRTECPTRLDHSVWVHILRASSSGRHFTCVVALCSVSASVLQLQAGLPASCQRREVLDVLCRRHLFNDSHGIAG